MANILFLGREPIKNYNKNHLMWILDNNHT